MINVNDEIQFNDSSTVIVIMKIDADEVIFHTKLDKGDVRTIDRLTFDQKTS